MRRRGKHLGPYFIQRRKGAIPSRPHYFPAMTFLKISAVFLLPLLVLFVASLASENQRHFLACRQTGASADACLLQISGR